MSISSLVVEARKKTGLTQQELADKANITVRTLQRIENGHVTPRTYTLKAIALVLNLDLSAIEPPDTSLHQLKLVQLSCFSYLIIPYVHFIIPAYILKRQTSLSKEAQLKGRKMIEEQVVWLVATHLTLLITLIYNLTVVHLNAGYATVSYFVPFAFLYLGNAYFIFYKYNRL